MKRLEYFSQNNEIYFFCVVDSDDEYKYRTDLLKYCKEVHLYRRKKGAALFKLIQGTFCMCISMDSINEERYRCMFRKRKDRLGDSRISTDAR